MDTKPYFKYMRLSAGLFKQLGAISIKEAVEMLRDIGNVDEGILISGEHGNHSSSPWRLLNEKYSADYPAAGCRIIFFGGPPGSNYWYTGTLLTMIIDKLLTKITLERLKFFYYERPGFKVKVS